ncbi:MAG: peptide deformylase [Pirellulaceae bacterium]
MVTPPVALAGYASASIAEAPIMQTSVAAFRFSLVGFTLPFMFVYRPALCLLAPEGKCDLRGSSCRDGGVIGILALAAGIAGFFRHGLSIFERFWMFVSAALLLAPITKIGEIRVGLWVDVFGALLFLSVITYGTFCDAIILRNYAECSTIELLTPESLQSVIPCRLKSLPIPIRLFVIKASRSMRCDKALRQTADEMLELMYLANGVGLAANQVDIPLRMFVVNPTGQRGDGEELVLINPVIKRPKGNQKAKEGCLSLPGLYGTVTRPKEIHLSAFDIKGNPVERTLDDFLGRVIQHEYDHLDGVMFIDRMPDESLRRIGRIVDEFEIDFESRRQSGAHPHRRTDRHDRTVGTAICLTPDRATLRCQ